MDHQGLGLFGVTCFQGNNGWGRGYWSWGMVQVGVVTKHVPGRHRNALARPVVVNRCSVRNLSSHQSCSWCPIRLRNEQTVQIWPHCQIECLSHRIPGIPDPAPAEPVVRVHLTAHGGGVGGSPHTVCSLTLT